MYASTLLASGREAMAFQQPGKERLARVSDNLVTPKALILDRWAHVVTTEPKAYVLASRAQVFQGPTSRQKTGRWCHRGPRRPVL